MSIHKNLLGNVYGKLTVIKHLGNIKGNHQWLCQCKCGATTRKATSTLNKGKVAHCGCIKRGADLDLTGKVFTEWTVIDQGKRVNGEIYWNCLCSCGSVVNVRGKDLRYGKSTKCKECAIHEVSYIHGLSKSPVYRVHLNMIERCVNKRVSSYKRYGGRGITVCNDWQDLNTFHNWCMDNGWKDGLELDRIDNDGNYEPSNCHFITPSENCRNRRDTIYVTYEGITKPLIALCEELSLNHSRVYDRIHKQGWSVNRAIETPKQNTGVKI